MVVVGKLTTMFITKRCDMARTYKCPVCGKMNILEEAEKHNKRYYCHECLQNKLEEAKNNSDGWDELFNYIYELYGEKPTGRMFKQLAEYRKPPYNCTNTGMLLTLKYFYETLGNPVIEGTGVGIIPYVYEEAKNNYIRQKDINEANQERQYNGTKKYIKINPIKNHNEKPIIDFNALEVDDE